MELDIKSSTADKLIDIGNDFLQKFAGPSAIAQGLIWEDNMKIRRLKNQIKNFEKVKAIAAIGNIKLKQIDLKALFPYLEGIALEENEELQDLWANLFVNYIDADVNLEVIVYPSILKQLSTDEVKVLQFVKVNKYLVTEPSLYNKTTEIDLKSEWVANLERLGLIESQLMSHLGGTSKTGKFTLSSFGTEFMNACTR